MTIDQNTKLYLPEGLVPENPFWDFSLALWERPKLRKQLLRMQNERHLRISLLLYSAWTACLKRCIDWSVVKEDQTLTHWQKLMVDPLRASRMRLAGSSANAVQMKQAIQSAELQAERWEMAILHHELNYFTQNQSERPCVEALISNLLVYTDKKHRSDLREFIACLLDDAFYQSELKEHAPDNWAELLL